MRKLRLNLDALQVESFEAGTESIGGVGTVRGNAKATYACTDGWAGCPIGTLDHTCDVLCFETVRPTCDYSCGDATCYTCNPESQQGYFTCGYYSCDGLCP